MLTTVLSWGAMVGGEGVDVGSHGWQWQCDMDVCAVKQLQAQLFPVCNKGNFYWSVSLPPTAIARFLYFTIRPLYSISMRIGFDHASLVYYSNVIRKNWGRLATDSCVHKNTYTLLSRFIYGPRLFLLTANVDFHESIWPREVRFRFIHSSERILLCTHKV